MPLKPHPLLRYALLVDALTSTVFALGLVLLAGLLFPLLGLPEGLLRGIGVGLLPYGLALFWIARHPSPVRVKAVIGLNLFWVADSLMLLGSKLIAPTALGAAFILVQAVAVGGVTLAQIIGLRRSNPADGRPA